jgi:hypothetical protein
MGKLKEKYINNMDAYEIEFSDSEYTYCNWFTNEINDSIKIKYSDTDVNYVLDELMVDNKKLKKEILKKLDIYYSEKSGLL